jgi:hypothetical protein
MKHLITAFLFSLTLLSAHAEEGVVAKPYFPIDEEGKKGVSGFQVQWYSKHLSLMKEKPLQPLAQDAKEEVYRFTFLPTWGDPQSFRLSKVNGEYVLTFARLDGDGGYDPGKLVETTTKNLLKKDVDEFLKLFGAVGFFAQPSEDEHRGLDGSEWILEAVSGGKYHVVVRWTPTEYDPQKRGTVNFVKACEWLVAQAPTKGEQDGGGQPATRPESK